MMIIDCGRCAERADEQRRGDANQGDANQGDANQGDANHGDANQGDAGCRGCMIGALLDTPDGIEDLTAGELRAIETFELAGFEVELLETPAPPMAVPVPLFPAPGRVA
jgi:hypothetical protein